LALDEAKLAAKGAAWQKKPASKGGSETGEGEPQPRKQQAFTGGRGLGAS
jgi:hypothetical protein